MEYIDENKGEEHHDEDDDNYTELRIKGIL